MRTPALALVLLALLCARPAHSLRQARPAQQEPASAAADPLRIYLATYGPGAAVWEKFGHNAIWVQDLRTGEAVSYNWGMFSFDQPGFMGRLMRGNMLYWMMPQHALLEADQYVAAGRAIRLQELNLAPDAQLEMARFLEWNARPENRFYEYDPFRDNCSTRVRDAIDRALGGRLRTALEPQATSATWRSESLRLTAAAPAVFTGLELAMADPVDRPLSKWETGFIPMNLADAITGVSAADGTALVRSDTVIFAGAGFGADRAPDRTLLYLVAGILIGGAFLLSARLARSGGIARLPFALIGGSWGLIVGFVGLLLALLWGFTGHDVTYRNENLLQASPLVLLLAALAPLAVYGRPRARRAACFVAAGLAVLSLFGLALQLFPAFDQYNRHVLALMVPAHLSMALAVYGLQDSGSSGADAADR